MSRGLAPVQSKQANMDQVRPQTSAGGAASAKIGMQGHGVGRAGEL
jgi:hypothetical protein